MFPIKLHIRNIILPACLPVTLIAGECVRIARFKRQLGDGATARAALPLTGEHFPLAALAITTTASATAAPPLLMTIATLKSGRPARFKREFRYGAAAAATRPISLMHTYLLMLLTIPKPTFRVRCTPPLQTR
jgi:hypothetical protein